MWHEHTDIATIVEIDIKKKKFKKGEMIFNLRFVILQVRINSLD